MSSETLEFVFTQMVDYQNIIQKTQQLDASTANHLSMLLMQVYKTWEQKINNLVSHPPSTKKNNGAESEWATKLQTYQSESQEATTQVKPYVDADTQAMQSDGNASQEVSQLIMTVDGILSSTANLLQASY